MKTLTIKLSQIYSETGNIEANVRQMEKTLELSEYDAVDVTVFPQRFLSGVLTEETITEAADTYRTDRFKHFQELARRYNQWIVFNFPFFTLDGFYDTTVLLDTNGDIRSLHQSKHIRPVEASLFQSGELSEPVDTPFGRVVLTTGEDMMQETLPEADWYFIVDACVEGGSEARHERLQAIERASNGTVVYMNRVGQLNGDMYGGGSAVYYGGECLTEKKQTFYTPIITVPPEPKEPWEV